MYITCTQRCHIITCTQRCNMYHMYTEVSHKSHMHTEILHVSQIYRQIPICIIYTQTCTGRSQVAHPPLYSQVLGQAFLSHPARLLPHSLQDLLSPSSSSPPPSSSLSCIVFCPGHRPPPPFSLPTQGPHPDVLHRISSAMVFCPSCNLEISSLSFLTGERT